MVFFEIPKISNKYCNMPGSLNSPFWTNQNNTSTKTRKYKKNTLNYVAVFRALLDPVFWRTHLASNELVNSWRYVRGSSGTSRDFQYFQVLQALPGTSRHYLLLLLLLLFLLLSFFNTYPSGLPQTSVVGINPGGVWGRQALPELNTNFEDETTLSYS